MSKKVLVTGGSGFLAFHAMEEARRQHYEVVAAIRPSSDTSHLKEAGISFVYLDYANQQSMEKLLKEQAIDYIIHTAGTTKAKNQALYNQVNAGFTENLARAAMACGCKKFLFVSSLAVMGPSVNGEKINEDREPRPITSYGRSKWLAEQKLMAIQGLPFIALRPTAVYGPREKDLYILFKTINRGLEPYIGTNPQQLSFVYVKDLAKLMVNALQSKEVGKAYLVSDGEAYDRLKLAAEVKLALKKKTIRFSLPVLVVKFLATLLETTAGFSGKTPALNKEKIKELTATWVCDIDLARKELGFDPTYKLENGIKETMDWYKKNRWL